MRTLSWSHWQQEVVSTLRDLFRDVVGDVGREDVDWEAWRPLYDAGHSPLAAVNRAFALDL